MNDLKDNSVATMVITVAGMGLTIYSEVYLIKEILEQRGYDVELTDEYPPKEKIDTKKIVGKNRKIKLKAVHAPWPG